MLLAAMLMAGCSGKEDERYSYARSIESWQARETCRPEHKGPYVEPDLWGILEISSALHEGWENRSGREKWGLRDYFQACEESRDSLNSMGAGPHFPRAAGYATSLSAEGNENKCGPDARQWLSRDALRMAAGLSEEKSLAGRHWKCEPAPQLMHMLKTRSL